MLLQTFGSFDRHLTHSPAFNRPETWNINSLSKTQCIILSLGRVRGFAFYQIDNFLFWHLPYQVSNYKKLKNKFKFRATIAKFRCTIFILRATNSKYRPLVPLERPFRKGHKTHVLCRHMVTVCRLFYNIS